MTLTYRESKLDIPPDAVVDAYSKMPVYDTDGKTVLYDVLHIRVRVPRPTSPPDDPVVIVEQ